eukprot:scaffold9176_cov52-Phaeocystis_antarctica.AAC.1
MSTAHPAFPPLSHTRSTDRRGARVIFLIGCTQGRGVGCYLVFALARMSNTVFPRVCGFLLVSACQTRPVSLSAVDHSPHSATQNVK